MIRSSVQKHRFGSRDLEGEGLSSLQTIHLSVTQSAIQI